MDRLKKENIKLFNSVCKRYISTIKITPEPDKSKLKETLKYIKKNLKPQRY